MKLISVVGARPNFVKIAPIIAAIRQSSTGIEHLLVHTGQHYDYEMSQVFFEDLELPQPDYHLGVGSGTHAEQTGRTMIEVERVLLQERPDVVIVVGDVNSTLAAALAAAKLGVLVAHVEAGMRSFDRTMPEETNRVLTDHVSDLLFCPTRTAVENLRREGITTGVHLTGDVMVDALVSCREAAETSDVLERLGLTSKQYLVATVHRACNTDCRENLQSILDALSASREKVVFPVHPRTRQAMARMGIGRPTGNVALIDPLGYLDFLKLVGHARKVITDSGGVQKEAYIAGVHCITLRQTTEWAETMEGGWNVLVGTVQGQIERAISAPAGDGPPGDAFGRGTAASRIVQIVQETAGAQWVNG